MSRIAEKRAWEAYPPCINSNGFDLAESRRESYIVGYDQAMQDFMEKACEWLSKNARNYYSAYATSDKLIEHFKNYMQNE